MSTARIVSIDYDPPGDDVAGEHVVIRNTGTATLDLSGWSIRDAAPLRPHVFHFNQIVLPPRGEVRVWTGPGSNTASDLYWNLGSAVWNNPGDTAVLRDAQDTEADRYSYLPAPTTAEPLRIAVPAFWQLTPEYDAHWQAVKQAGSAVSVVVIEGSWPAFAATNPTFKAAAQAHLDSLPGAVLGYVGTRDGLARMTDDAILASVQPWYDQFGGQIDGIYFDELVIPEDPTATDTALALLARFKADHPGARAMILAGQCFREEVLSSPLVDWALLWETRQLPYRSDFYPLTDGGNLGVAVPSWWKNPEYRSRIVHVVHDCAEPDRQRVLGLANERNAGNVFVMDRRGLRDGSDALYDHLPPYWDLEVREANSYYDFGFEPRLVLLAARRYGVGQGALHAWPNFEAAWYGNEHRRGTFLLDAGAHAQTREVLAAELGNVPLYDIPRLWRAAHEYARGQGFETAIPTFEQVDSSAGPRYRLVLLATGLPWLHAVTVPVAETYQQPTFAEPGSVIRNVNRWTHAQGYKAAFPTFVPQNPSDPRGKGSSYAAYAFDAAAPVTWRDVVTPVYLQQL